MEPEVLQRQSGTLLHMKGHIVHGGWTTARVTVSRAINLFGTDWLRVTLSLVAPLPMSSSLPPSPTAAISDEYSHPFDLNGDWMRMIVQECLAPLADWYDKMEDTLIKYRELRGQCDVRTHVYGWERVQVKGKDEEKKFCDEDGGRLATDDEKKSLLPRTVFWPMVHEWGKRPHVPSNAKHRPLLEKAFPAGALLVSSFFLALRVARGCGHCMLGFVLTPSVGDWGD